MEYFERGRVCGVLKVIKKSEVVVSLFIMFRLFLLFLEKW